MELSLTLVSDGSAQPLTGTVNETVIAGWTARDKEAMEAHIRELEEIGVPRPVRTPIYYRVTSSLLTTARDLEVLGDATSGEVEFVIIAFDGELYIGVGSDHTDREAEKASIPLSKQLCPKPIGEQVWKLDDVTDHWNDLTLRSSAYIGGEWEPYQQGPVSTIQEPQDLLRNYTGTATPRDGLVMYCGTLPVDGGVRAADQFAIELEDPVLRRKLSHTYKMTTLPVVN